MKHFKWYTWVGIGLVFFVLTITLGKMTVFVKDVAHTEAISVKVKSEQVQSNMKMETETKESDTFTSIITIPYTDIKEVDEAVHKWAKEEEQAFYDQLEASETFFRKKINGEFSIESELKQLTDDAFQIKLNAIQSVDGSEEEKTIKTYAFHMEDESILDLDEIVENAQTNQKEFKSLFKENTDNEIDDKKLKEALADINKLDWFINKDKEEIVFYFDKDDISDQKETIDIPFVDFYTYFTDDYYDVFITEELQAKIDEIKAEEKRKKEEELQESKKIAITFDDGPHPTETERILDTLDKYDAEATFFMLSKNVKAYPDIAKEVVDQGHEIANHSITHPNLETVNNDQAREEVVNSSETIEEITGVQPKFFRPPYGNYTDEIVNLASETKQSIILWSIDTRDWDNLNPNAIYQNISNQARPGSIVLMHDIHSTTADSLPKVLKNLKKEGYEFVTVSEIMPYLEDQGIGPYYGN